MFFRQSKSRRRHQPAARASVGGEDASREAQREAQQLEDWRRSAQKVTRAWNAWLAAEARERSVRYRAYVAALAEEERAAAAAKRIIENGQQSGEGTVGAGQRSGSPC